MPGNETCLHHPPFFLTFPFYLNRVNETVKYSNVCLAQYCTSVGQSSLPALTPTEPSSDVEYSTSEDVSVEGHDVPAPILNFSDIQWPAEVQGIIDRHNFAHPTTIQCQTIPIALENRDLIGISHTGSGKTLAFILPTAAKVINSTIDHSNPVSLVVAPTRELCNQIYQVARAFSCLSAVPVYGGKHKQEQVNSLTRGRPRMVIATPGRLIDLLMDGVVSLEEVRTVVLDEADRMLDMGFEPQIRKIFSYLPEERQTMMFSATWPEEVRALASDFLQDPIRITIGSDQLYANPAIKQVIKFVSPSEKDRQLIELLDSLCDPRTKRLPKTLLFTKTKKFADIVSSALQYRGFNCQVIHGGKTQAQRESVLHSFRSSKQSFTRRQCDILVATDVAARGLDVRDIEVVINYDFPDTCEDYIHRIGRTARSKLGGTAYSFFTREDSSLAEDLITVLKQSNHTVDPQLERLAEYARQNRAMKRRAKRSSRGDGNWFDHHGRGSHRFY